MVKVNKCTTAPPVTSFDLLENVYIEHSDGSTEWIGPYRDQDVKIVPNPKQRADAYSTIFGLK